MYMEVVTYVNSPFRLDEASTMKYVYYSIKKCGFHTTKWSRRKGIVAEITVEDAEKNI